MRICPLPEAWERTRIELEKIREQELRTGSLLGPVPVPLILAGWAYSNDTDKMNRWKALKDWASNAGCQNLVEKIEDDEWYEVDTPTTYIVGPLGGPMYQTWSSKPRPRADKMEKRRWLSTLVSRWNEIAGPSLSQFTCPGCMTGPKGRRLLVYVIDPSSLPPWGSWYSLPNDSRRASFRELRVRINEVLKPHAVDHVDFIHKRLDRNPRETEKGEL